MHVTYAMDLVRQRDERSEARTGEKARHLAALRAACFQAPGLRGLLGACATSAGRER